MPFYENVFIARQDISAAQADTLAETFTNVITENGGKVTKKENWGLRNIAYRIKKNRKGHYVLLNIDAPPAAVQEMERQMRISEDILRYLTTRVEELEDAPDAPRVVYRTRASLGESEDLIIGSLTYLPAVLAAGTVVASAGVVAAAITGTAIAGALIGTVLARWLDERHANYLSEQLEHGGLLLWVRTRNKEQESAALRILADHSGADVHLHQLPATRAP